MAQISCENLELGYEGKSVAEPVSFSVSSGDYLCIVGENGSGKSTLMKTLLGLQKPLGGKLDFGDGLCHNDIGYLPQQTDVQRDFPASVFEVVMSGLEAKRGLRPFYRRSEKEEAARLLERLDISRYQNRCYRELSGGQQQRVLLCRALLAARSVLLLDEPVAGLDPRVTEEMYGIIDKLHQEGTTIIMVSHDLPAAMKYATHILHVGHPVFFGTREEYQESAAGKIFLAPAGTEAEK